MITYNIKNTKKKEKKISDTISNNNRINSEVSDNEYIRSTNNTLT